MKFSVITPTNDPKFLDETYESLKQQTYVDWEWVVFVNGPKAPFYVEHLHGKYGKDPHVRIVTAPNHGWGIGAIKYHAFMQGLGEWLIELDHDDQLRGDALEMIAAASSKHPDIDFFYSDWAEFGDLTRRNFATEEQVAAWKRDGWAFYYERSATCMDDLCAQAFTPSAATMSSLLYTPNHVRVWRRDFYHQIGGHNPTMRHTDDHELLIRTYLYGRMHHIRAPLYSYRLHENNSWRPNGNAIQAESRRLGREHLEALVLREARLRKLPCFDLGCGRNPRYGFNGVDENPDVSPDKVANLAHPWPWENESVFCFRAYDFLEHVTDKQHVMDEIWRCLAPGGWLLSATPSSDGRGADMDPTHKSRWNENSFWYWIRKEQAEFIDNHDQLFGAAVLGTEYPSDWHREHDISYVYAHLHKPAPRQPFPKAV